MYMFLLAVFIGITFYIRYSLVAADYPLTGTLFLKRGSDFEFNCLSTASETPLTSTILG